MGTLFILGEMAYQLRDEGPAVQLVPLLAGATIMVVSSRFARKIKCGNLLLFCCLALGFIWAAAPTESGFAGDFDMQESSADYVSGRTFAYVRKCEENSSGRFKLIMKTEIGDVISYTENEIEPGSFLLVSCTVSDIEGATNPGAMDLEQYYAGIGVKYSAEIEENSIYIIGSETGDYKKYGVGLGWRVRGVFVKGLYRFRKRLARGLESSLEPRDAGLLKAMLLGDKSDFDVIDKTVFQRVGMSHIFAISGLHITLIALGVEWLLKQLGMTRKKRTIVSIGIVFTYAVMTGMSAATMRALVMYVVSKGAFVAGRTMDVPTSMITALLIILVVNPQQIFSTGVLMSFLSVGGLYFGGNVSSKTMGENLDWVKIRGGDYDKRSGVLKGFLKVAIHNVSRMLIEKLITSIAISIWMLPAIIYIYYEVPVFAMLLNLILLPLLTILVAGGSICAVFGNKVPFIAWPVKLLISFYRWVCYGMNGIRFSSICTGHMPVWGLGIMIMIVAGYSYMFLRAPKRILKIDGLQVKDDFRDELDSSPVHSVEIYKYLLGCTLIFLLGIGVVRQANLSQTEVAFLDVGQGDGSIIHVADDGIGRAFGRGRSYIVDCGSSSMEGDTLGRYTLIPALKYYAIDELDCVFISHTDTDHVNGVIFLLENAELYGIRVKNFAYAAGTVQDENLIRIEDTCKGTSEMIGLSEGEVVDEKFYVIYPEVDNSAKESSAIDNSAKKEGLSDKGENPRKSGNDYSLVMFFITDDFEVLYTGDISSEVEIYLLDKLDSYGDLIDVSGKSLAGVLDSKGESNKRYKILKCPHHGSRYSSSEELLAAYAPDLTVISCGENNVYGHPAEVTLGRLKKSGSGILRTDKDGAIVLR